jgi:hypothetical protein
MRNKLIALGLTTTFVVTPVAVGTTSAQAGSSWTKHPTTVQTVQKVKPTDAWW